MCLSLIPKIYWLCPKYNLGKYWNQNFCSNQNSFFAKYLIEPKFRASSETNSYIYKWLYILQIFSHLICCFILSLTAMLKVRKGRDSFHSKSENRIVTAKGLRWGFLLKISKSSFKFWNTKKKGGEDSTWIWLHYIVLTVWKIDYDYISSFFSAYI